MFRALPAFLRNLTNAEAVPICHGSDSHIGFALQKVWRARNRPQNTGAGASTRAGFWPARQLFIHRPARVRTRTAGLVEAERTRTARAHDDERGAKEAEQKANAELTAALERETRLKGDLQTALERSEIAEKSAAEQRSLALQTVRDVVYQIDARLKDWPDPQEERKAVAAAEEELRKCLQGQSVPGVWSH